MAFSVNIDINKKEKEKDMSTLEQMMQNLPLSTDIATQEELNNGITNISSSLIGTIEDLSSADTINGSKKYAKEYTNGAINTVISGAPHTFDTLKEIADWISSDQTSSAKLISDIIDLQRDVAAVSNDLSIDISRVTVTEDDGFQKGNSLGFVGNSNLTNPYYVTNGSDSYAFPISVLTGECDFTNEELSNDIYNYDSSFANTIYGYKDDNGSYPKLLTSLYGFFNGTQVSAHYGSPQYGADMIEWQDSNGTTYDGTSVNILPAKVITLSNGTKIFREPRVYYYCPIGGLEIYASFTLFVDYEAILKKKVQTYDSIVSATYATKNEVADSLTGCVDLVSNQTVRGKKNFINDCTFGNLEASYLSSWNRIVSSTRIDRYALMDGEYSGFITRCELNGLGLYCSPSERGINVGKFYSGDDPSRFDEVSTDIWIFPEHKYDDSVYTFASENFVLSVLSSNDSSLSDIYVLSSEVVEGLSNAVVPKLSTIADLVSAEVEKVDDISANYVPLTAFQALEARVSALESRLSDYETIIDQINGTN